MLIILVSGEFMRFNAKNMHDKENAFTSSPFLHHAYFF